MQDAWNNGLKVQAMVCLPLALTLPPLLVGDLYSCRECMLGNTVLLFATETLYEDR
jgi:hypothetical protein